MRKEIPPPPSPPLTRKGYSIRDDKLVKYTLVSSAIFIMIFIISSGFYNYYLLCQAIAENVVK